MKLKDIKFTGQTISLLHFCNKELLLFFVVKLTFLTTCIDDSRKYLLKGSQLVACG